MKKATFISFFVCTITLFSNSFLHAQSPLQVSLGEDRTLCYGSYVDLTAYIAGGTAPYTYRWTPDSELSSTNSQTVNAAPTYTTTYKVIVTDANGNTAKDDVRIEVVQRPDVRIAPPFTSINSGESIKLTASVRNANGACTYQWRPSRGLDNANSNNPTASPNMTTTYTVLVKDSKGCTATEQISVTVSNDAQASLKER
jgi:hypothetical protein